MAAYCFFDIKEITDRAKMDEYRRGVLATVKQFGGRYLVLGDKWEVIEGTWRPTFPVLIRFPSLEAAHKWYRSDEYKDLLALRLSGSKGDAVFMESPPGEFVTGD
jgi:uncharacterized protein (DUF1330 family)